MLSLWNYDKTNRNKSKRSGSNARKSIIFRACSLINDLDGACFLLAQTGKGYCDLINVLYVGVFLIGHLVEKIEDTWLDNKEQKYYDI